MARLIWRRDRKGTKLIHSAGASPHVATRLIACVLLPFAAGYFLSYLFRTSTPYRRRPVAELNLSAADLGLLDGCLLSVFAAVQLPLGALLDRFGPSLVQSVLMLLASAGALISLGPILHGSRHRPHLIGLEVAVALDGRLKAIVMSFPPRPAGAGHGMVGDPRCAGRPDRHRARRAAGPAHRLARPVRDACRPSGVAALIVLFAAPESIGSQHRGVWPPASRRSTAIRDFWRIAPLSAAWRWHFLVSPGSLGFAVVARRRRARPRSHRPPSWRYGPRCLRRCAPVRDGGRPVTPGRRQDPRACSYRFWGSPCSRRLPWFSGGLCRRCCPGRPLPRPGRRRC